MRKLRFLLASSCLVLSVGVLPQRAAGERYVHIPTHHSVARIPESADPGGTAMISLPVLRISRIPPFEVKMVSTHAIRTIATQRTTTQPQVPPAVMAAWEKVAQCEEGGNWHANGPLYSGGLGISRVNWIAYGGLQFAPDGADATPAEQVIVAERIQQNPPDQDGCTGSW